MRFEVKRSEWLAGKHTDNFESMLYNAECQMRCCLGFFANAVGFSDKQIEGVLCPQNLDDIQCEDKFEGLVYQESEFTKYNYDTDVCEAIMKVNDDVSMPNKAREERLTELFSQIGHEIVFVD